MTIPKPIHPFPARMAASIPWKVLEKHCSGAPLRVLDPMAGSGTTMVVARALGHEALGFDTDPLAVLIASAWCSDVDPAAVKRATRRVVLKASSWKDIRSKDAYPHGADAETRGFVSYWFDLTSRRQLTALARSICTVRNVSVRRLLWCAFSRLIIVKQAGASRAMDVAHSRPHRKYVTSPIRPLEKFALSVDRVLAASPFAGRAEKFPEATISIGDARKLAIATGSVDVVITSPPYLNAIDYMRGHRLSLVWMQHSVEKLRAIRSGNIGTEAGRSDRPSDDDLAQAFKAGTRGRELSAADQGMFTRYLRDVRKMLGEIRRVLKPRGMVVIVVGDCNLRGVFVKNSLAIKALSFNQGLRLVAERTRSLPKNRRYLPPPQSSGAGLELGQRMRKEVVLTFAAS